MGPTAGPQKLGEMSVLIYSQNLRGMSPEKEEELASRLNSKHVWAACLQETWRLGSTSWKNRGLTFLHGGLAARQPKRRATQGVAIVLGPEATKAWELAGSRVLRFGTRIIATRLKLLDPARNPLTIYLVSAYAPDSSQKPEVLAAYEADMARCLSERAPTDLLMWGTDANASLGVSSRDDDPSEAGHDQVLGHHGVPRVNAAGRRLHEVLGAHGLCAPTTFFQKTPRGGHAYAHDTWRHPGSRQPHQIDHFFIRRKDLRSVLAAGPVNWGVDSDHRAIVMRFRILRTIVRPPAPRVKVDREKLQNKDTADAFRAATARNRERLLGERDGPGEATASDKRDVLEEAIRAASEETLGADKGRWRPGWFVASEERLMAAIDARNVAQERFNATFVPTAEDKAELTKTRKVVRREVEEAKEAWTMKLVGEINDRQSADDRRELAPKEVWQVIRALQKGPRVVVEITPMNLRKDQVAGTGDMCETEGENRDVMVKELRKTFSQTGSFDPAAVDEVPLRPEQVWMDKPLDDAEVSRATRKLANGRSGGDAKLYGEYYKALDKDPETRVFLKEVLDEFWKSDSFPGGEIPAGPPPAVEPTLARWREKQWPISYLQANPKRAEFNGMPSKSFVRYEGYKGATTIAAAMASGASAADVKWDLEHGFMALHPPPEDRVLGPLPGDGGEVKYDAWLMARLVLLPKKGDLSLCKNWRGICLLDVASKIFSSVLVARMGVVMEKFGFDAQVGFRWDRGTIDGLFATFVGLSKRKEHGLETWALFIDLVKAFDTVPREALFAVLRRFGLPDHFVKVVMRLHFGAKVKVKIGEEDSEVDSTIGVRQGSCEGPVLFLFIMQAAMETLQWPDGVARPEFMTRESGVTMGENSTRKRDATSFELWASLFADDCALLFNSRDDLITGSNHIFSHLRKFGLQMHIGRGAAASKTEAMYFPPPRQAYAAADTSRFLVDGSGFVEFSESFKYLGSIIHYSLTSDADVHKRVKSATAAFGALKNLFGDKYLSEKVKGQVYTALVLSTLLYGCEVWSLREDLFQRLRSFHNRCARSMCRISIAHTIRHSITSESLFRRLGIMDLDSYYHNRVLRWAGHVARMPMSRMPRQLLTGWVAHPRPIGCPEMTFGRTLKKALKRNDLPTDFAAWSAIARDRSRWRLLTHSTPTPSPPTPNPPTPSPPTPSPPTPNQPPANPNAPLPGYGNIAPVYVAPTWYAPLAHAQYAETQAADRAARLAARANRANAAPPQQHHLAQGIALDN